jgi:hypothetical protein
MEALCLAQPREPARFGRSLRRCSGARPAYVIVSVMWLVACGDAGDTELSQDASNVLLPDAGQSSGNDAAASSSSGQPGGNVGTGGTLSGTGTGGTPGGASLDAGAGATPGGGILRPDAGRFDAGRPTDAGAPPAVDAAPAGDGGPDQFAEVRQICVDTINMYRATLSLPPLARGSAAQEACSDEGAKYDGDINRGKPANQVVGHLSTMNRSPACAKVGFGAQDACPNWGVGPRTGNATLADAIKKCLAQMWAEGMPPVPVADCIRDSTCFPKYGHWINMSSMSSKAVACGFYNVEGTTYWMNQDFSTR